MIISKELRVVRGISIAEKLTAARAKSGPLLGTSGFIRAVSQAPDMKAAINIDSLARAEREATADDSAHGSGHVFRLSPAADGRDSFGDQTVVFVANRPGHVSGDDTGRDFENGDFLGGQSVCKQPGHHRHGGLG